MTAIYFAHMWGSGLVTDELCPKIGVLASFANERAQRRSTYQDWKFMLQQSHLRGLAVDSGAYSFTKEPVPVDVSEYADFIERLGLASNPLVDMIFSLDVIGDWRASQRNTIALNARGLKVVPTWHAGSPIDVLKGMARDYPRIAIGGVARMKGEERRRVIAKAFSAVWPARIHGFGIHSPALLDEFPFDSVDATSAWQEVTFQGRVAMASGGLGSEKLDVHVRGTYPRTRIPAGESRLPMTVIARNILNIEHRYSMRWSRELARWRS